MTFWNTGRRAAVTLAFALTVASCDHASSPMEVSDSPEQIEAPQEGLLSGLLGGLTGGEITVRARDENGNIGRYTLVREPLLTSLLGTVLQTVDGLLSIVTELIGLNGGTLNNLGHRLVVPSGAVDQPTTFSLGVLLNGRVQLDLNAYAPGRSGQTNVGEEGFDRLVRVDMTYRRANNIRDERKLVILRLNPRGLGYVHEVMPTTVDRRNDRATTWLDHFSGYAMAQ